MSSSQVNGVRIHHRELWLYLQRCLALGGICLRW